MVLHLDRKSICFLFAVLSCGLWFTAIAWGHPGQHLDLKITIDDEAVTFNILLSIDYARHLVPQHNYASQYSAADNAFHFQSPEQERELRRAYEEHFGALNMVEIDGLPIKAILARLEFVTAISGAGGTNLQEFGAPDAFPPDLALRLAFPSKGRPRQVAMVWDLYPVDPARSAAGLPTVTALMAELEAYAERRFIIFSPEEPEVIWHAPVGTPAQQAPPVVAVSEPSTIPIPLVSVGVAAIWMLGLLGLHVMSAPRFARRIAWWCTVVPVVLTVYFHDVAVVSLAAPWGRALKPPDAAEATKIFTVLQRNVYRAFDYTNESDVYDVLAQSVAGEMLDRVFNEVYQSLILRDQGGAVARVHSVDILKTDLLSAGRSSAGDHLAFCLRCHWRVYGVVAHWGHFHSRTNEYEALYTVAQLERNWKIVGVEVLQQQRVDGDEDNLPDAGGSP